MSNTPTIKRPNLRKERSLPRNSFLIGMGSVFNLAGNYFRLKKSGRDGLEADMRAIRNDWNAIGNDMYRSLDKALKDLKSKDKERSGLL